MGILSLFGLSPKTQPGVYCISNKRNGKAYIGSTTRRICDRWCEHRKHLTAGVHHNKGLQADWDRYGANAFRFYVLEVVADPVAVLERELHWQQNKQNVYTEKHAKPRRSKVRWSPFWPALDAPDDVWLIWLALTRDGRNEYAYLPERIVKGLNGRTTACTVDDVLNIRANEVSFVQYARQWHVQPPVQ